VIFGLGLWAAPDIAAMISAPRKVQTSARLECPRPSELETVLVYVNVDADGSLRVECNAVAGRGAYK
jgi:hypothetical protein